MMHRMPDGSMMKGATHPKPLARLMNSPASPMTAAGAAMMMAAPSVSKYMMEAGEKKMTAKQMEKDAQKARLSKLKA
jgi:hypothetical protein